MDYYCTQCGKTLQSKAEFCAYCGKKIKSSNTVSDLQIDSRKNKIYSKKHSKYLLNDSQRRLFLYRIVPLLIIGCAIWLVAEIILSSIFIEYSFNIEFFIIYTIFVVTDVIVFILFFLTARKNLVLLSLLFYFMFTCLAGSLSLPIIIFNPSLSRQIIMLIVASLEGTIVVALISLILRSRYLSKGNLLIHISLFLIFLALSEVVFFLIFSIENWILTFSITFPYILIVSLILTFYGAKAVKKVDKQPWPYILCKILFILLVSLIIAIAIAIIVLFIIGLAILGGNGNFDLSGLNFGGIGRRRKKEKGM